jgi:hypothetical protein
MENNTHRQIKSGLDYERYFTKPTGLNEDIKRGSNLQDTLAFLPKAIQRSKHQVKAFCKTFKSKDVDGVCSELWHWLYTHIRYHKDDKGKEQIRSPRRSFYDRQRGVDCDDYTVFISACLSQFGIPHVLRIAKYKQENGFQHIYPIVPLSDGTYITVDCVVDRYNYEVPPIQTIDKHMDLEYLDGIDDDMPMSDMSGIDADDLLQGYEEMGELGRRLRNTRIANTVKRTVQKVGQSKVYNKIRQGVHAVNRINPATALLRAGILASLKLNLFKVAEQLRYGYLSSQQAMAKGFDMDKFNRLVGVKNRLQKIFYGAGGKEENFKLAILTGRGNSNREVMAGLGDIDNNPYTLESDLSDILGIESYDSEMQGVEGIDGLGEPATGAAIAAATSVMSAIAGLLKGIGSLRKKQPSGQGDEGQSNGSKEEPSTDSPSSDTPTSDSPSVNDNPSTRGQGTSFNAKDGSDNSSGSNAPETNADPSNTTDANGSATNEESRNSGEVKSVVTASASKKDKLTPLVKAKTWVKANPVKAGVIAVAAAGLVTWAVVAFSKSKKKKKEKGGGDLSGVMRSKKNKGKKHARKKSHPYHSGKGSKHGSHIRIQKLR